MRSRELFPLFSFISDRAASPFSLLRQTRITVAPISASPAAVAFPIPELAPATMQMRPGILFSNLQPALQETANRPASSVTVPPAKYDRFDVPATRRISRPARTESERLPHLR